MTPKQKRFVEEYLIDLNATRAAERAGYSHPNVQCARLLANVSIAAAIEAAQAELSERVGITQDYVLRTIRDTVRRCSQKKGFQPNAVLKGTELLGKHLGMFKERIVHEGDPLSALYDHVADRSREMVKHGGNGADPDGK